MGAKKILWGVRLNRVSVCFALPRIQNLTFLEAISFHQGVQLLSSTTTSSLITKVSILFYNFTPHHNTFIQLGTIIFDQGVQLVISNCQLLSSTTIHLWLQKFFTTLHSCYAPLRRPYENWPKVACQQQPRFTITEFFIPALFFQMAVSRKRNKIF